MKLFACVQTLLALACFSVPQPEGRAEPAAPAKIVVQQGEAEELLAQAQRLYAEGSYAKAHEQYARLAKLELAPERRAWVEFRVQDTRWRSAAQSNDPDASELDGAAHELRRMLERFERPETRTDLFAEIHESLGDGTWRERSQDWGGSWAHYQPALEWWAHSSDLEKARARYLGIVWKAALPPWREQYWGSGYFPSFLPLDVLANAATIAETEEERARAQFLLGRAWMNQGHEPRAAQRIESALGAVLELGKRSEWYDDALYALGTWQEGQGRWERDANGNLAPRPDFSRAVELYRRLVSEFSKGETRYFDEVQGRIRQITEPVLGLEVGRFFLPGSEVEYGLSWRNLERVELELVPIDLVRDVSFASDGSDDWLSTLALTRTAPAARWNHDTKETGKHEPGQARLTLAAKPATGAYVLRARGAGREARALVLVSDAAVTVKVSGTKLLAWATDVRSGAPISEADLRLWERWHDGQWHKAERSAQSDADGVALFELGSQRNGGQYFVALASGARQAYAQSWIPGTNEAQREWRIYATTDRAAYRPGDPVQWKLWARTRFGGAYQTPAGESIDWEINDPQGTALKSGTSTLDAFGAAWGTLETTAQMTLGEYQVVFRRKAKNQHLGQATLFRLEEYELPEYEVKVKSPLDAAGRPKLFRLGDRVEIEIESTYYHGAPVAGAAVEVFVHQRPRYRPVRKEREFPWFYDDARESSWWGGEGQQIFHDTRTSDPAGRAVIGFDTPADARGEFEFVVQARVVDASRREITGRGSVVVAELGYRVDLEVAHALHRPGTKIGVDLRASDPNDNPVADDGKLTITRERWIEVWRDAAGRDVFGDALARAQSEPGFPGPGWSPKSRGYERETITTLDLRTGADGRARFEFTPPKEGYYRLAWASTDEWGGEIRAEAAVFVADERTQQLGYLPGGIEILVDQDTLAVGQEASLLLLTPQSGRWVLFTVEGEELTQHQVLHLEGQVKLVKLPITAAHVPNVFLGAVSLWGGQAFQDTAELIVPPVEQFLSVELTPDSAEREPGAKGSFGVLVKDRSGAPVKASLSLAVVDEAVSYIQQDYALDPRRFFYGDKRAQLVQTGGSFQHGAYVELVQDEKGGLRDARTAGLGEDQLRELDALGYGGRSDELKDGFFLGRKEGRQLKAGLAMERSAPSSAPMGAAAAAEGGNLAFVPEESVRVRSDFRATALWLPDVTTDEAGKAAVELTFPDSTTRWKASARALDTGTRVGQGSTTVRTRLPLIARLQTPRFLVVGDVATLSANLDNNTSEPMVVESVLEAAGLAKDQVEASRVTVPANGSLRVDWSVTAREAGTARLKLVARGTSHADAVERTLPVLAHGIDAHVDLAGKLDANPDGAGAIELALVLPAAGRPDSTHLSVTLAPSLAVTMLDALPYLVDYPYGCVEQTLSRFLPAVVVAKTLREHGLSVEDAMTRVFGGIELDSATKTHPKGKEALTKLDELTRAGLERLYDFQHGDGGWAWWKEGDSDPFMSAYVLWGLALAREAGLDVRSAVCENAARYLAAELVEAERQPDLQAWMLHALAVDGGAGREADARKFQAKAFDNLWGQRDQLNAYGRALLCLAAKHMDKSEQARLLAENLANGAIRDAAPDTSVLQVGTHQPYTLPTAHWGQDGMYRRWSEGGVEATAFVLRALVAVDPKSELVTPVMNWLVKNRRGAQWSNTRDTAICVLALDEYLEASGELGAAVEYELAVNGTSVATRRLEKSELLAAPGTFEIDPRLLKDGANAIRITRKAGAGPLYFAARASFFSTEEPVPPRGNELFVRRDLYRLAARKTLLAGTVYERVPLADGDALESGERVEVVLTVEAKNELEYIVLEDLKAAGLEAVQIRSGEPIAAQELTRVEGAARFAAGDVPGDGTAEQDARRRGTGRDVAVEARVGEGYTGRARSAHQELRDRQVAFFLDKLPQGLWELRYELRAETPGRFHALPALGHAMYVPEIRANGAELRLAVQDP